nr:MAG TPA: hypothetical protein [Caudoviricetes sp.]
MKFCRRWLPVRVAIFFLSYKFGFSEKVVYLCTRELVTH